MFQTAVSLSLIRVNNAIEYQQQVKILANSKFTFHHYLYYYLLWWTYCPWSLSTGGASVFSFFQRNVK